MWRSPLLVLVAAVILAGCGQAAQSSSGTARHARHARAKATGASTAATRTAPSHKLAVHRPDPGRLPQTTQLPSSSTPQFHQEMADLWQGITSGTTAPAMPAFFPETAYAQVKAISDPRADWMSRLVGGYTADIAAAHALLGAGASSARLLSVQVPSGYAHWVVPGTCYNGIGYWETPNSRIVYSENGQERSFGIASMISWRGVWYVVHLGAVLRSGTGGVVDDPSSGPGYAAPSSTC
ncbi:MAG TPA: hypothetical protein VFP55_07940 [Solirubrobacteraceae bacterium]|nr:hypothetical protein [Solirubrobacteraceae bacterium]